jgi:hypothetical protein
MDPTLPDFKNFYKNSAVFYSRFQQFPAGIQHIKNYENFLLSHLVHSQIWLKLFVGNWQSGYIKNLRKQTPHSTLKIKHSKIF